jgi:LPS-assembly protein
MKRLFDVGCLMQVCLAILVMTLCMSTDSLAATTITADKVENIRAENKYIATGNVVITKDTAVYKADVAIYSEKTEDMQLSGHVVLEDKDFIINTEQAEFNAGTKKGMLHNGVIFLKHGKNWIHGINLQKIGDDHYYAKTVYFTACDSEQYRTGSVLKTRKFDNSEKPDWCFRGEDADILVGDKITATNVTYRIKDIPVLYSPYFQGPADNERKTGLLMPTIGSSSTKGFLFGPSFFWAIDENMDATINADYFSKRGVGTGLEYRFVDVNHQGNWYAYQLYDQKLKEQFVVARATDRYTTPGLQAFVDINYVNRFNYYSEYGDTHQLTMSRFLQSSAEVSAPVSLGSSSRAYLLSQYWVNLRGDIAEHVPQKLPEAGYVLNPTAIGPMILTLSANAANFVRKSDPNGQRFDILPTISHSIGDTIRLTQSISLRETAYNLSDEGSYGSNLHREMFQYRGQVQTRFVKNYGTFMHIIEPSVEYNYIPNAKALPLFDSTELPVRESVVQAVLMNRFMFRGLNVSLRLTQPYDTFASTDNAVLPTRLQGSVAGPVLPVNLNFLAEYDSRNRRLETVNSGVSFKIFRDVTLGLGELYSHVDGMMLISPSINAALSRYWILTATASYDVRATQRLRDLAIAMTYKEQCWSIKTIFTRRPTDGVRPADYTFVVFIELRGFGGFKL